MRPNRATRISVAVTFLAFVIVVAGVVAALDEIGVAW